MNEKHEAPCALAISVVKVGDTSGPEEANEDQASALAPEPQSQLPLLLCLLFFCTHLKPS